MSRDVEQFTLLDFEVRLLDGGGHSSFSVQQWRAQPYAGGIPLHLHRRTEEAFYVVAGEIEMWLGDQSAVHGAGAYLVVPPGRHHTFRNPGGEPASYLTIVAPSGFERYLAELARGLEGATTDADAAHVRRRLAAQYDIVVVGPPPL